MKCIRQYSRLATLAAALVAILATQTLLATEAQARETTATGPNGKSATRTAQRESGDVSSSTTTGAGKAVGSRSVERSASSSTATATGPRGKSASRDTTRTSTGSSTTVTGPNGQSGTVGVAR